LGREELCEPSRGSGAPLLEKNMELWDVDTGSCPPELRERAGRMAAEEASDMLAPSVCSQLEPPNGSASRIGAVPMVSVGVVNARKDLDEFGDGLAVFRSCCG
jgi:hypothetical protein